MTAREYYWGDVNLRNSAVAHERGFESVSAHDDYVTQMWRQNVKPADTVYVLGNLTSLSARYTHLSLELLGTLPGTKILIPGNQDEIHPVNRRGRIDTLWRTVFDDVRLFDYHSYAGYRFMLSHFPYAPATDASESTTDNYGQFRLPDCGLPLVHAHTQQPESGIATNPTHRMFSVGVETCPQPVSKDEIGDWLTQLAITQRA